MWIAATRCLPAFQHATRLVIKSPEKGCGKSGLLDVIVETCHAPLITANASTACLFRSLTGDQPPTILLDEADTKFGAKAKVEHDEELRGLLNAGFDRDRPVLRTVGPNFTPTAFASFAKATLAGIGSMPDTIEDRAAVITMRRRAEEVIHPYRQRRDRPGLNAMRDRLAQVSYLGQNVAMTEIPERDPKPPLDLSVFQSPDLTRPPEPGPHPRSRCQKIDSGRVRESLVPMEWQQRR